LSTISWTLHRLNGLVDFILNLFFHDELFITVYDDMQISDRLASTVYACRTILLLYVSFDLGKSIGDNTAHMGFHAR